MIVQKTPQASNYRIKYLMKYKNVLKNKNISFAGIIIL